MTRFSYFFLPLASPWLHIWRLTFSLALRSCITCYPRLETFFLNSPQWSSLSMPSIFCWDLGLLLVGNKKQESVRRGLWTDLCYGRSIWKPHKRVYWMDHAGDSQLSWLKGTRTWTRHRAVWMEMTPGQKSLWMQKWSISWYLVSIWSE